MLRLSACVLLCYVVTTVAATAQGTPTPVRALADRYWEWSVRQNPLRMTREGVPGADDRLPSVAPAVLAARADSIRGFVVALQGIDAATMAPQDRITADIMSLEWREELDDFTRGTIRAPVNAEGGFHSSLGSLPQATPVRTVADLDNYASRLAQVPRYFREYIGWMQQGMRDGYMPPRVILEGMEATMQLMTPNAEASLFYEPVRRLPASLPDSARQRVAARVARVISDSVSRAYGDLFRFFVDEYRPAARATIGARDLPDGAAYYREQVTLYTTLPLDPDSVHALGLREVARIRTEMDVARARIGFKGTHAAFLRVLRTDPRFKPKTGEELLLAASRIAKRMDHELPRLFRLLPRQPYGVVPVPSHLERKYTAGRYSGAPIAGTRAGEYWVNLYQPESRTLYTLEALTLHEAVPGHHLQTALAQELGDLPAVRRNAYFSAFGEGWGLYSERLGLEVGFYADPFSDFGRLTYEMWRACRLVVDTGMHWKGWSRQQAIDYLAANTALSLLEVGTEIDRYIGWPGQALSYKIGEIEIRKLRAEAELALGDRFDVRAFHDVVLRNGSVPLTTLRREVEAWLAAGGR